MSIEGRRILLTGGAGAIGTLVARQLISRGASLAVIDRAHDLSFEAEYWRGDLGSLSGIAEITGKTAAFAPDILIHLAGLQYFGAFDTQAVQDMHTSYMVNLVAPALLTRSVLPRMWENHAGHVVFVGSILGSINYAHFVTYSSAKAGLRGLSEGLRRELRDSGIAVTYIAPRAVRAGLTSASIQRFAQATNMRMDEPETAANHIVHAILKRRKDVYIGFSERFFVGVNALAPRLVDAALAANTRKAANLLDLESNKGDIP